MLVGGVLEQQQKGERLNISDRIRRTEHKKKGKRREVTNQMDKWRQEYL
jgi:hypothetical protein